MSLSSLIRSIKYILIVSTLFYTSNAIAGDTIKIDFGAEGGGNFSARLIQMIALMTVLSVAPSILIMTTSFTKIVVVMSILRTALGLQQSPPNSVLISLSLFLTFFIMTPTFEKAYNEGITPLLEERIDEVEAFSKITTPIRLFMIEHVRAKDLQLFQEIAKTQKDQKIEDTALFIVTPAFMLSELKRAFEIGFLIFLPFLIIDMVVASTLMAMGMMMIPPIMISLPFKLIFFVMIDGWYMLCGSIVKSYTN